MTHYTSELFDVFDRTRAGINNEESAIGFWFADTENFAFNDPEKRPIKLNVYLKMSNPLVFDGQGTETTPFIGTAKEQLDPYTQFVEMFNDIMYENPDMWYEKDYMDFFGDMQTEKFKKYFPNLTQDAKQDVINKIVQAIQNKGFDSIIIKNTQMDSLNPDERINQYVVFNSETIDYTINGENKVYETFVNLHKELGLIDNAPELFTGTKEDARKSLNSNVQSPIETITIQEQHINHLFDDNEPTRRTFLNYALETIKKPNIITEEGNKRYYIKLFYDDKNDVKNHLQIVKVTSNGTFYVTNYRTDKTKINNIIKEGQIIYDLSNNQNYAGNNNIISKYKKVNSQIKSTDNIGICFCL